MILAELEIQLETTPTATLTIQHQDTIKIAHLEARLTLLEITIAVPQEITTVALQEIIHLILVATIRVVELLTVITAVEDRTVGEDKI